MRIRWLLCLLLVFAWAAAPVLADPPTTKSKAKENDGKKKQRKKTRKKKARTSDKKAKSKKSDSAKSKQNTKQTDADDSEDADRPPPQRDLAIKGLRIVVGNALFEEMPFEDFTEWVARTTGANVVVRWSILEAAGVERAFPIYIKAKDLTVQKLLQLAFAQVTYDLASIELAARADGNTIVISSRKDINTKRITRVYEAQHMVVVVPDFGSGSLDGEPKRRRGSRGSGGIAKKGCSGSGCCGSGGCSGKSDEEEERRQRRELIDFITGTIQPLSWKVNGGKGTLKWFRGKLVVYNNEEVHAMLREFFPEAGE